MAEVTLKVPNISCHHCIMTITRELKQLPAVRKVEGSVENKKVRVEYEGDALDAIKQTLAEIGYPAEG
ncbi:MAG: heavy-metal-associated domain-containing protein [Anaerolineae bacterium]